LEPLTDVEPDESPAHRSRAIMHRDPRARGQAPRPETGQILGSIPKRGNRYLRALFVQAPGRLLVRVGPNHWERYGLKSCIEARKKRLNHNVLAIALANKLDRIVWSGLAHG
jgi:transposase